MERRPLLVNDGQFDVPPGAVGPAEPARYWVLFWYAYIAALQSLLWLTYSSVPDHSKAFLEVDDGTLIWFLNEGPMAYCLSVPFVVRVLDSRLGLRRCVRAGAVLCFLGAGIRCIPFLVSTPEHPMDHNLATALIHIAQSLNAAAAPFVVASVSHLSLVWYDEAGRNTATAVANVASALGRAVGFYLGPAMVSRPNELRGLLLLELGLAALSLVAVFVYYPPHPGRPPSVAAAIVAASGRPGGAKTPGMGSLSEIKAALSKPNFVAVALAGGLSMGVYGMWSGTLPSVLPKAWSDTTKGYFGMANTLAGIVAGVLAGMLTDLKSMRRRLKSVMMLTLAIAGGFFALFALSLPPLQAPGLDELGADKRWLLAICTAAGFFRGMSDPLFFEMAAETLFPQSAGTAGSILTFWYHVTLVVSLSVPAAVMMDSALMTMAGVTGVCVLLLALTRVEYVRR